MVKQQLWYLTTFSLKEEQGKSYARECYRSATYTPSCASQRESSMHKVSKQTSSSLTEKPASETPWTNTLWIYDLRTNVHFTLKTNTLRYEDLKDFIMCYNTANLQERKESDRFHVFTYDQIMQRDKVNLDIFWLRDESLEDTDNLPDPDVIAQEIAENLEDALEQFSGISSSLNLK